MDAFFILFLWLRRDSILRYPHYVYQRVDTTVARQCGACNRRSPTAIVAFLSGSSYDPRRVRRSCIGG